MSSLVRPYFLTQISAAYSAHWAPLLPTSITLCGGRIKIAAAAPALVENRLHPEEKLYIEGAVPKRRAEFATARVCARRALRKLGITPSALVPNADHSPRWPAGVVGSISHTKGCCLVAVTSSSRITGLGIDLERNRPLDPALLPLVCTPNEVRLINNSAAEDRGWLGTLFFCAKEAIYKCQYPLTKTMIEFCDIELKINLNSGTFNVLQVRNPGEVRVHVQSLTGRFFRKRGFIVTMAIIPH